MNRDLTLLRFIVMTAENVNHHASGACSAFTQERAISYELIALGEAVKDISDDLKKSYPYIPWQLISGTRDRLAHDYEDVSPKVIWDIVNVHLPLLVNEVQKIIATLEGK